ncbi:TPA: DUF968 domain-containing protein [Escherichia coli]|nr:DUF968 domain-containing protein [Escherichia coli]HBB9720089.1 DUF968 domain-containing protein [Escherichia coli]
MRVEKILNRSGIQPLHRKCSFSNYQVQNEGQRYALSQAKSIADELMTGCTNFAFSGKPGTGKNHLAAAIGNRLLKDGQTVIVVTVADVMSALHASYDDGQSSESLGQLAHQNLSAWMIDVIGHAISGTQERELSLAELSWWAVRNQVADALPEAVLRRSLGLRAEKIRSMYRESDIVPGEQTATSILKQRTKNLAPLPHAHQQQNPPQEKTVVSIAVDPESPESFMKRPKRRRWVNEKYTRWVKTQPCACCSKPADDPHHLIGHGQGGMGTKSHDIFTLPLCREHHNELHADPMAFEEKHGSQVDLIFRFLDHAFATGVLG